MIIYYDSSILSNIRRLNCYSDFAIPAAYRSRISIRQIRNFVIWLRNKPEVTIYITESADKDARMPPAVAVRGA